MRLLSSLYNVFSTSKYLACLLSLLVICFSAYNVDKMIQKALMEELEDDVTKELYLLKTRVEGQLNSNIQLVRGLVYTIKTEPNLGQDRFSELAQQIFYEDSLLNVVAAAPNLVNKLIYPFDKYKKMIGKDYKKDPELLKDALLARKTNKVALAGPLELKIGGGTGVIARFPINLNTNGSSQFWGMVSAVISIDRLIEQSLEKINEWSINVAIENIDSEGISGDRFYGDTMLTNENAMVVDMKLSTGHWRFYAAPKNDWVIPADIMLYERILIFVISILLFAPVVIVTRFADQKQKALGLLAKREEELVSAYARAEYLSLHDHLTKLPNRRYLEIYSNKLNTHETPKNSNKITAFVIDLDDFKEVNDKLGHAVGDEVLIHVSKILKKQIRVNDFVSRVGGDEFIILSLNCDNEKAIKQICSRIISEVEKPFYSAGQYIQIGASIGVAVSNRINPSFDDLIKTADQALYAAKENGRNDYKINNQVSK